MIWCIKSYIIAYAKIQQNEDIPSSMSNLQPNWCLKIDFQKVDQHAGGKWLIHDTKVRCSLTWNDFTHITYFVGLLAYIYIYIYIYITRFISRFFRELAAICMTLCLNYASSHIYLYGFSCSNTWQSTSQSMVNIVVLKPICCQVALIIY